MGEEGITILGTAGDSITVGRQVRASGGFILSTSTNQIHVDPGPGSLVQLAKNDYHPRETTAIVLTHQHVNHAGDASALISTMTHNGIDKRGVFISNTLDDSIVPEHFRFLTEKAIALKPGSRMAINDVEIKAVNALHYDSEAVGYLFYMQGYTLGYTGDTKYYSDLAEQFKEANILIVNCKYPNDHSEGDHLNTENIIDMLRDIKPQLVVLTHFGSKMLNADPLAQARIIQRATKVQVVAAKDGLHISPASYDAKRKQKTLSGY